MAKGIQFIRSVPRWLLARLLARHYTGWATGPLACIRLTELQPPPLPTPEWVRIKPRLSGVCGSDLATIACQGSPYFSPFVSTPFVLGHEVVGDMVEIGAAVPASWKIGERVVIEPALTCRGRGIQPVCPSCASGQPAHCESIVQGSIKPGIQTGYCASTGGGWSAATLVAHHTQLHRVPPGLEDDEAVLAEPLACALHGALRAPIDPQSTLLVLGCGTIGLLVIHAYRLTGGKARILAIARHSHQEQMAKRLGADEGYAGPGGQPLYRWVLERTDRPLANGRLFQPELGKPVLLGGADCVFDCVGSSQSLDDALRLARPNATVVLVGMPGLARGVDWTRAWYKQLVIKGSYAFGWEELPSGRKVQTMSLALEFLARGKGVLKPLVKHRFPLEEYRAALDQAFHVGRSESFKTVFELP